MKTHHYQTKVVWTGNEGSGTSSYKAYNRNHTISVTGKSAPILGSSDPAFRGDKTRYNPEEMLLASLSACHLLWYLHLCSIHDVVVIEYIDQATGVMEETENGSGRFTEVVLHPSITVEKENMIAKAITLHHEANQMCFIANSCNFSVKHAPHVVAKNLI